MMSPDVVILSVNDNLDYLSALPVTVRSWKKYFPEAKVLVGMVGVDKYDFDGSPIETECEIAQYPAVKGISTVNQSRILRYYLAALQGRQVVTTHDVDSVIMERKFFEEKLQQFDRERFFALGHDMHPVAGKFPAGYSTATGDVWAEVVGMNGSYYDWPHFVGVQAHLPGAADVLRPAMSPNDPVSTQLRGFCDEEWLVYRLSRWKGGVTRVDFGKENWARIATQRNFFIDNAIEIHHLIPKSKFGGQYQQIEEHLR